MAEGSRDFQVHPDIRWARDLEEVFRFEEGPERSPGLDPGRVIIKRPGENVVLVEMGGLLEGIHSAKAITGMRPYFDERMQHLGFDLSGISAYTSETRKVMTGWLLDHRDRIDSLHMHSESPVVRMGMSLVARILGGNFLEVHPTLLSLIQTLRSEAGATLEATRSSH